MDNKIFKYLDETDGMASEPSSNETYSRPADSYGSIVPQNYRKVKFSYRGVNSEGNRYIKNVQL